MHKITEWFCLNPTFPVILGSAVIAFLAFQTTRHLTRCKHAIDFETAYHQSESLSWAFKNLLAWSVHASAADTAALASPAMKTHEMLGYMRELLNTWERVAIAIRQRVYDENLLYNAYGTSVIWIWKQTLPFIRRRQQENPKLFINFDWLAIRWQIRRDSRTDAANLHKLKTAHALLQRIR